MAKRWSKFKLDWLNNPMYSPWLEMTGHNKMAKCNVCKCTIEVSSMGKSALDSHMKSKKHEDRVNVSTKSNTLLTAWVQQNEMSRAKASSASTDQQPSTSLSQQSYTPQQSSSTIIPESSTMQSYISKDDVSRAEILWTLNMITNHYSFNSSKHSSMLFQTMFPDSDIAKKIACGATKIKYLSVFGLAPYYEQKLLTTLDEVPYYSISFDESFNRITKNEQMDFCIRYWDAEIQQVVDHYLTSKFIGHATANDLLQCFKDTTAKLKQQNIIQVSMDGPNVNIKFLKNLISEREDSDPDLPSLIDLGTCGLHVVHGAFRTGFENTGWKVDRLLRSLWYLFSESPARRQDFTEITSSSIFPLQFGGTRWVEDCPVAERAISIWDNIKKYVNKIELGPKNKIPKCSSYKTVCIAVNEPLTCARLQVFVTTAKVMQPFLQMFQSNKPMAPFLAEEIYKMMKDLMEKFVKKELLTGSVSSLMEVDVSDSKNQVDNKKINIGFAAKTSLSKVNVGVIRETEFKHQCLDCYKSIVCKLKERSPIKYDFVLNLRSLRPQYIIRHPNTSITHFEKLLDSMIEYNFFNAPECDKLLTQYKSLLGLIQLEHEERFSEFDLKSENRLDVLFHEIIGRKPEYNELWKFCKLIFTLSHGQSAIERGFSINKNVIETNMMEKTIIAERMICDSVRKELLKEGCDNISKVNISKEMLRVCSKARVTYESYLVEKRERVKESSIEAKKLKITEELVRKKESVKLDQGL